ncbi:MAG: YgjP-like metallopeptidase domain-containing protein [Butyricicoccus sp.]
MLSKKSKAIGFIIMSAFGFAMMAAFVRLAGDLPFTQKTFFRNLVAVAVAAVVLCREKVGFKWEKGNLPLLIIRATCGTLGIFCNYYAIDHLVLADANILNKMSPFFAIIFSLILLKERASVFQYAAVLAAFGSSMLIIKPGFSSATFPAIIGLLGGMGAGAAYTCVRALSRKGEKSARIVFFFSMFSTLVCVPAMITDYHPMTWGQFFCLIGAGASAAPDSGVTLAYANAPAKEISVFDHTRSSSAVLGFSCSASCRTAGASSAICRSAAFRSRCSLQPQSGRKDSNMIEYELVRSKRKTLAVQVTREGRVIVRAPLRLAKYRIERFVAEHTDWIARALADQQSRRAAHPEPDEAKQAELIRRAKIELPPKVQHYAKLMNLYPTGLKITSARTRFGSCSGKNSICFSWRLMDYPELAIDYVVVHELAHIVHKNHGPQFWALVERYLPDYRARRAMLRE